MNNISIEQILNFIEQKGKARAEDLRNEFGYSRGLIHRQLKKLIAENKINRVGKPPLVFYTIASSQKATAGDWQTDPKLIKFIDLNYLYVTPTGEIVSGYEGFKKWVSAIKQDKYLLQLATEYIKTRKEVNKFYNKGGFIDATEKVKATFDKCNLNKLFYLDFYSLPKFGKTKLGQQVLYAKQAQSRGLIKEISKECKGKIENLIKNKNIEAVAFIPPTVPRQLQFLKELERHLKIKIPKIDLVKAYKGDIPIAQKTLSRLEERVENAKSTIYTKGFAKTYKNVLIIDDAVGSGASLNETAQKLLKEKVAKKVYGFAIVGSYKGFDVIREI
ncbi:MAG: phosphoribosyltransferase family protein [Patescibacteria group bacterium]|nr:hypothetical protein [Patescibacteria group bacterium]